MSRKPRALQVVFESPEGFLAEYQKNLANGGVFVASHAHAEPRELVEVDLQLGFCERSVRLPGEVVHIVPPEVEASGATPGVAVQFSQPPPDVRKALEPLVVVCGSRPPAGDDDARRSAPRTPARVPVRIDGDEERLDGRTRNISQSGMLVSLERGSVEIGQRLRLSLENPTTGEVMNLDGHVAREVETAGDVAAIGIAFDPPEDRREEVQRFVQDVQRVEHARQLGGIKGAIEELGPQNLLQMFGSTAPSGTLVLRRGEDEGVVGFEGGLLRYVKLGRGTGVKALTRLLSWTSGTFEFHARLEPGPASEAPLPLEAAVFDATRKLDEVRRIDASRFPPEARVVVSDDPQGDFSKLEEAILDLARAGFTVQRIIDVIPEPDPDVLRAFATLVDAGEIQLQR